MKSFRRRQFCLGVGGVVSLVLLVAVGGVWQAVATRNFERHHPPPGRLVDVGAHRWHIHVRGEGSPTVVIEAGLTGASYHYEKVADGIAPVVVISRRVEEGAPEFDRFWVEKQRALAGISTRGSFVMASTPQHAIQEYEPQLIAAAVREMVESLRPRHENIAR